MRPLSCHCPSSIHVCGLGSFVVQSVHSMATFSSCVLLESLETIHIVASTCKEMFVPTRFDLNKLLNDKYSLSL